MKIQYKKNVNLVFNIENFLYLETLISYAIILFTQPQVTTTNVTKFLKYTM